MKRGLLAAFVAAGLASLATSPAGALTQDHLDGSVAPALVTPVMSAAKQRRLYMMQTIQRQQQVYGRGFGYGRPPSYGAYGSPPGARYGGPPRLHYGPPRGGFYGY